jgi:uncharacterized lipoprotein YbaY
MKLKFLISFVWIPFVFFAIVLSLFSRSAVAQEATLALCETDRHSIRLYRQNGQVFMRAYDRQERVIWVNQTPTRSQTISEGTLYTNLQGEQPINVLVSSDRNCAVQIGDRPLESGTLVEREPSVAEIMNELAIVTGTVAYLPRIALPPQAVVEVKLLNVSRADAPAITIAEQIISTNGRQVPIPFSLSYDPEAIDPQHRYAVQARILINDRLRWINTTQYPVITQGNPSIVDILVQFVDSSPEGTEDDTGRTED